MQFDRSNFTPVQQTLTVSENEARMGISREIMLPSGERLSIFIPPGTFSGKVIPVERQGMPPVLVTVNVSPGMAPPPPPPLEKTQMATPQVSNPQLQWNQGQGANAQTQWGQGSQGQGANPQAQWNQGQVQGANAQTQWGQGSIPPVPLNQGQRTPPPAKPNRTRIFVLAGVALLIIIAAVIGIFAFTTVQHNQQVTATATAQNQTQVAQNNLNGTATQAANAAATQAVVNATATAANAFPAVAGNYSGTLTNNANAGKQFVMALALQQNQQSLTGTCSLASLPFPIQNGSVTQSGQVTFSITVPASGSSSATQFNFVGTQQSAGGLSGTYTASGGGEGPWVVTKS
ncbi:MAG: hypothetical protein ACYDER_25765 [Ktedonobacteraceae bacterium]